MAMIYFFIFSINMKNTELSFLSKKDKFCWNRFSIRKF